MQTFSHGALPAIIVASALGALTMCLLVLRFGLMPPPDETSAQATRRLLFTRLGHAFAGACFAVSAMLAVVALVPRPAPAPAGPSATDQAVARMDAEAKALDARLKTVEEKVGKVDGVASRAESRAAGAETAAKKLGDEVTQASARIRQWERERAAMEAKANAVKRPVGVVETPKAVPATPIMRRERLSGSASPRTSAAVAPRPETVHEPEEMTPLPLITEPPPDEVVPRSEPARKMPQEISTKKEPASGPAPDVRSKVKRDWESIKQGFKNAGRDIETAITEQARRLRDVLR